MKEHSLLQAVYRIAKEAKRHKLSDKLFTKVSEEIKLVGEFLHIPATDVVILSLVFVIKYEQDNAVSLNYLAAYLNVDNLKLLEYKTSFDSLTDSDLLIKGSYRNRRKHNFIYSEYEVPENVAIAIVDGAKVVKNEPVIHEDILNLLENIDRILDSCPEEESIAGPISEIEGLLARHRDFPLLKKLGVYKLNSIEQTLLLQLIWSALNGEEDIDLNRSLEQLLDFPRKKIQYMQDLMLGRSPLIRYKLVELDKSGFLNNSVLKLGEKAIELLKEEGFELYSHKEGNRNIIVPSIITRKDLFFNESMEKQLAPLRASLVETNLIKIRERLKKLGHPTGINVLFYGHPGTGKTELVYQLARATNREIIHVDISETKSKWFGDSEKRIKKVFTNYNQYLEHASHTPVLLFNEADALIKRRRDSALSNTDHTENALQNIILEELEKFSGLFFATTNFVSNLDSAFERRFLYKIKFPRPDASVRVRIWKSKARGLRKREYEALADSYDFTGGQIDNVVRKMETSEVIHGTRADFGMIQDFCEQERLERNGKRRIGFTVNS
ncbi:MAG: ATP-binding protein [Cyclobacteriaceae bacterium]|nr:ATP-binding protein [Cyclobacteriaceae bacterium]